NGRFSFYEDNEPDGFMFNEEEDGYCKNCGKDFQNNGLFCCKECEEIYEKKILAKIINNAEICEICGKKIPEFWLEGREKAEKMLNIKLPKGKIDHHITYEEDETMVVCPSCHAKIHHSKDPKYDKYRPKDKRPKRKSQYKLVPCGLCKGKTRVPYDADKDKKYLCYRCKKKYRDYYRNWRKDSLSNPNEKHTKEYWEFTRKGS
ncbi:MAG: hypothetical protein KKA79_00850, partial [Nanoarchaeota archaeon]|nr:hypothetical protein [Nanoarchaeota archaeon]